MAREEPLAGALVGREIEDAHQDLVQRWRLACQRSRFVRPWSFTRRQSASSPSLRNQTVAVAVCLGVTVMAAWASPVAAARVVGFMCGGSGMPSGKPQWIVRGRLTGRWPISLIVDADTS